MCTGNGDVNVQELQCSRKGHFFDNHSKCNAITSIQRKVHMYFVLAYMVHVIKVTKRVCFISCIYTGSSLTAYVESQLSNSPTIHHNQCEIATAKENSRCQAYSSWIMITRLEDHTEIHKENQIAQVVE